MCRSHGGSAPQVQANAASRIAEQEARRLLARMDVQPVDDPLTELRRLAGQVLAWRDVCAEQLNKLTSIRYEAAGGEQLRAEVALFERALDRCAQVLIGIAKLNLDERLAAVTERQADALLRALDAGIAVLDVPADQAQRARSVVARELRQVM